MAQTSDVARTLLASKLWQAHLKGRNVRYDLLQFMRDASVQKRYVDEALNSGQPELIALAKQWLSLGEAQPPTPTMTSASAPIGPSAPASPPVVKPDADPTPPSPADPAKSRYLRGVR